MYPKELLPFVTTLSGNQGIAAAGVIVLATARTDVERWLLAVQLAEDDSILGIPLRLENSALVGFVQLGYRFSSLCSPICRRLPQGNNSLQWRNLSGVAGSTLAWTVVIADAPMNILSGAVGIINNRQGWGA